MRLAEENARPAPTVMVVAPRDGVGGAAAELLEREGLRVLSAETLEQAEDVLQAQTPAAVDVALVAPSAHGAGLHRLRALDPILPIVLLADDLGAGRRRGLVRKFRPYGVADWREGGERLLEWVESAAATASATRKTVEAHELRSLLAGRVSEELYGMLQVIRGYAEVLNEHSPAAPDAAERLHSAAEASLDLAQSWVDLRRLDRASICPQQESVDIGVLVEELGLLVRRRAAARPWRLHATCAVGEACVASDGEKLHALLAHLLLHIMEGEVAGEIVLEVGPAACGGTHFRLRPRHRASTARTDVSVAVAIAHRLGRLIDAEIDVDAGDSFIVRLTSPLWPKSEMDQQGSH